METERKPYTKKPIVKIDKQAMQASIRFEAPDQGEDKPHYTIQELKDFLSMSGVNYGIDQSEALLLCQEVPLEQDIVIARGLEPQAGENGYYEYHFSQEFSKKPSIRPDGSADFLNIKVIEVVHENDLIATYHPSVPGKRGMNVQGKMLEPPRVRDMPPLGGRGFHRSEDDLSYYADMDGKIVLQGNRILISPIYEIDRDADMSVGNIDFKGDVVIHGGVKHGIYIHATGSITIDGLVEHCDMRAGKDIFLLSGVKGGEQTTIQAVGNITAEFIEYANVSCKGDLRADVLFNCNVNCESRVIVTSGKRSAIIGGKITAIQGLSVLNVGNKFGAITRLVVGMDDERMLEAVTLREETSTLEANIAKIKKGVEDFDAISAEKGIFNKDDPRRMQLLRIKIRDEAIVAQNRARLDELQNMEVCGKRATVKVYNKVHAGVHVRIRGFSVHMSDYQKNVEFVRTDTGIRMEPLEDVIPEE